MLKKLGISTSLALTMGCLMPTSNVRAQQWDDSVQVTPVADFAASTQQQAPEQDNWRFVVGGGVGFMPTYEGSDEYEAVPIPVLNVEYADGLFFANVRDGIGSYLLRGENYKVGASLGYATGRDVDDDRKNLSGMGDLDPSATANLLGEFDLGAVQFTGKLSSGISGDYGTTAEFRVGSRFSLSESIMLLGSVGTTWADEEHMSNYFGVSASQSASSGYDQHDAESGFKSIGFSIGANYAITEEWNANITFRGDQLIGDAADSPIVKDEFVPAVFLTTSYGF